MERKKRRGKGVIAAVGLCAGLFAAGIAGISAFHAYYSDTRMKNNEFTNGNVEIQPHETFEPPEELKPGDVVNKIITLENTGYAPCYVRARIVFSDDALQKVLSLDYNRADWVQQDACFYYKNPLAAGEVTKPLIRQVIVSGDLTEEEWNAYGDFTLTVLSEAVQKKEAGSYEEAWKMTE